VEKIGAFCEQEGAFVIHLEDREIQVGSKPERVTLRDKRLQQPGRVNLLQGFLTVPSPVRTTFEDKLKDSSKTIQFNGWYAHTFSTDILDEIISDAGYGGSAAVDGELMEAFQYTNHLRGGREGPIYGMKHILDELTLMLGGGGSGSEEIRMNAVRDLRRFIAFSILFPNQVKKVMVYMKGPQGCGKDMLWQMLMGLVLGNRLLVGDELYPSAILGVNTSDDFFPKDWNDHFEHLLVLVSTDILHKNRAQAEEIKGRTTNEKFKIRKRFCSDREIVNRMAYIFLGNANMHFPPIHDDGISEIIRRLLALECGNISEYVPVDPATQRKMKEQGKTAYRVEIIDAFMDDIYVPVLNKYSDEYYEDRLNYRKVIVKSVLRWCVLQVKGVTISGLPVPTQTPFVQALLNFSKRRHAEMMIDALIDNIGPMLLYICNLEIPPGYCEEYIVCNVINRQAETEKVGIYHDPESRARRQKYGILIDEATLNESINSVVPDFRTKSSSNHDQLIRSALCDKKIIGTEVNILTFGKKGHDREVYAVSTYWVNTKKQFYLESLDLRLGTTRPRVYEMGPSHLKALQEIMSHRINSCNMPMPDAAMPDDVVEV